MATLNGVNYSNTLGLLLKTNATTQMSISTSGVIEFNESYTFPTSDGSANTVLLTNGSGALSFSTIPNASLDNSAITIAGASTPLGGSITGDEIIANVTGGQITNTQLVNSSITINGSAISLGGSINVGDITNVSAGNGLTGGGSTGSITLNVGAGTGISVASDTVGLDYYGTDNFIDSASDSEGTAIALTDTIIYSDDTDHNVKKGLVSDLPYSNNQGTVTSIAISGSDGIDVDSGSPITTSGTIALGLSNIPNGSLANSSITINGSLVSLGGSINVGDITNVIAGNGLTGGGSSGSVTLNVGAGTGLSVGADLIALDYLGTNNFIDSATNLEGTGIALTDTIIYHDATDNNVKKGLVSDLPYTNTSGTVTNVTVGTGLDVSNGSTTPNITLDLNELSTSTTDGHGDFFVVVDSLGVQRKLTKTSIGNNDFVNNAGYTTNTGTVTSIGISGTDGIDVDSGSPITSSGTISLGLSNVPNSSLTNSSITIAGSTISLGGAISGDSIIADVGAGEILISQLDENAITINGTSVSLGGSINVGDITAVTAGNGLTGGGTSGSVTLNIGAGTGIDVDGTSVNVDLSELTTSTSDAAGDFFVVVDSANNQKKLTKGNINNSGFNNDAGYITSAGNTNIYSSNGTLSGVRTLSQSGNKLKFDSSSAESFDVVKTTNATGDNGPRMYVEADNSYGTVLELESPNSGTDFIVSRNTANDRLFTVDGEGNLSAISKSFDIPHPNPEKEEQGMRLKHGNLEGPEHGVYLRGRQLNDKEIELPEYWLDLVDPDSITVQLTSVGSHQNLYVKEIKDNVVYIGNGNLFSNKIDCYYFIQAERKDIGKVQVEYTKK